MLGSISKEWMKEKNRVGPIYTKGVEDFIEFSNVNNVEGLSTLPCPCVKCRNRVRLTMVDVKNHLVRHGIDQTYTVWALHGENPFTNAVEHPTSKEVNEENTEQENLVDKGLAIENLVDDFYRVHEEPCLDARGSQDGIPEEPYVCNEKYNEYKRLSNEKLYPTCEGPETTLSAIVELHNIKKQFGWSGNSVTALLSILRKWLPKGNTLPEKYPRMKSMIKDFGMKANFIHTCINNCVLYWKENEELEECPQCGESRYVVSTRKGGRVFKEPMKVLRHFPIIPRLVRLYTIPWIAHEMTWHDRANSSWEYQRHPSDSSQWRMFKSKWPDFAKEGRNVWLAIAADGFNPRGIQSSSYSCWPVIAVPYNLPPSLCMKREFQMLSLLIPGPKAPGQDIDVFLQPLVQELKQLWEVGVQAYDMYIRQPFTLKAMLMWGIHDFPAYGNLSGCITHGYKACPICGDDTPSIRLEHGNKIVYTNYRIFLSMDHPFRGGGYLGLKSTEYRRPPSRLNGNGLLEKLSHIKYIPGKIPKAPGRKRNIGDMSGSGSGSGNVEAKEAWYKRSIFFDLEYWSSHQVRHVLDVMHIEKNVAEHIIGTILDDKVKTKDTMSARLDMKQLGIHSSQWVQVDEDSGKFIKPKASFLLDKEEKRHFCQILKDLKLPSSFSSNLSNIVTLNPPSLNSLKSHDYHVIMGNLLPVLLQHAFPKHRDLRRAIQQLSLFFNLLCSKVLIRKDIQRAKGMVAEALCVLEKHFPPSFFDISIHLTVHLADEALNCGPTGSRWMYPFERQMQEFKDIPSNKRYIEGSIAESYVVAESVRYCMEYMPNPLEGNHKRTHEAFLEEDGEFSDTGPLLDDKVVTLEPAQFQQIRRWVLFRLDIEGRDEYYSEYKALLKSASRGKVKGTKMTKVEKQTSFIPWLYEKLVNFRETETKATLWRLVQGPKHTVKTYKKYRANGFIFSPRYHDDTVVTQDSGVCMKAWTKFRARKSDKRLKDAWTMWYGVIRQILELDYLIFKVVVFYCDWVKVEDKTNGCKNCPDSNLVMVNFDKFKSISNEFDEPVILASEASQVFYSKDLKNPNWWVVLHSPKRLTSRVDDLKIPFSFQSILEDQPHLENLLMQHGSMVK